LCLKSEDIQLKYSKWYCHWELVYRVLWHSLVPVGWLPLQSAPRAIDPDGHSLSSCSAAYWPHLFLSLQLHASWLGSCSTTVPSSCMFQRCRCISARRACSPVSPIGQPLRCQTIFEVAPLHLEVSLFLSHVMRKILSNRPN
jgi:hypothetical protein